MDDSKPEAGACDRSSSEFDLKDDQLFEDLKQEESEGIPKYHVEYPSNVRNHQQQEEPKKRRRLSDKLSYEQKFMIAAGSAFACFGHSILILMKYFTGQTEKLAHTKNVKLLASSFYLVGVAAFLIFSEVLDEIDFEKKE